MAFVPVDLTNSYDLSSGGSLYIGTVKLEGFKNATLSFSGDSVDNSTRDQGGWSADTPSKRSCTLDVTCNKIAVGAAGTTGCQEGLRKLLLNGSYTTANNGTANYNWQTQGVTVTYKSVPDGTSGSAGTGFTGTFVLTSMSESQQAGSEAVEITYNFKNHGALTVA